MADRRAGTQRKAGFIQNGRRETGSLAAALKPRRALGSSRARGLPIWLEKSRAVVLRLGHEHPLGAG